MGHLCAVDLSMPCVLVMTKESPVPNGAHFEALRTEVQRNDAVHDWLPFDRIWPSIRHLD